MRAGACAVQQTLTSEAASVLKHSLTLARRRGHAQVTPLHVAATLLSSRSSLLRRACLKSQPHLASLTHHHPLQSRALELCFNVALNRLPTTPGPLLHGQPSLSNALIAALKRAQAHQRRGCIEQQPLLTVKVELEQLIISILDDPSVSRVMREAGFSSTAVKTNVEDAASSSVFHCYADAGVFSSPASPTAKDHNPNPSSTFWQTHFLTYSDHHNHRNSLINPLLFSSSTSPPPPKKQVSAALVNENDVKLVLQVLTREEKRKNTVIVGDGVSAIAAEVMARAEREDELKFVKLQHLSPVVLRFMKRSDVETNITELKRKLDSTNAISVIYVGDLNWTVDTSSPGEYNPADHMVAEVARLVTEYNNNGKKKKVCLMATASYNTYMRCQMRQPSLELQWDLHVVSVPSPDLSLTLNANSSVHDSKMSSSETKPFAQDDQQDQLCPECKSRFGEEVQLLKSSNQHKLLPPWLQPQGHEANHKEDLEELRRKWSRLCHGLHHLRPILNTNQRVYGRSCSYNSSYPWWPAKTTASFPGSNSISFVDSPLKPNVSSSFVPRFRKQESCTIEFNFGNGTAASEQDQKQRLDCFNDSSEQGKEVRVTLELGNGIKKVEDEKSSSDCLYKILADNVPWQSESIGSIVEALSGAKSSNKKESWLLIQGNDGIGKRRLAHAIAESICGSCDLVLHMNMRKRESEVTPSSEILARALGNHEKLVILIEDIDLADAQFIRFLAQGFETGNFGESWSKRKGSCSSCRAVFVLTKNDQDTMRGQDSVIQMTLNVTRCPNFVTPRSDHKRKAAEEEPDTPSKMARQSSFNALDLNVMAGEEEEERKEKSRELSPVSSDLTRETSLERSSPNGFIEAIEDKFVFNRNPGLDGERREGLVRRMRGSYSEVFGEGDRFSVEERVIGEVIEGSGSFVDSSFDKWLKDVFQTSLRRVRNGGKEGIAVIRLSYGGKGKQGDGVLWDGFMGSSLPKNILVVSSFD